MLWWAFLFVGVFLGRAQSDRVALVLGATSGIGRDLALRLCVKEGWRVIVSGRREDKGQEVVATCPDGKASFQRCDISNESDLKALFQPHPRIDTVFINSGVLPRPYNWLESSNTGPIDAMFNINMKGVLFSVRQTLKHFRQRNVTSGQIVISSSIGGSMPAGAHGGGSVGEVYRATKSFVDAIGRALAGYDHIQSLVVSPSVFRTEMVPTGDDAARVANNILTGVSGNADQVARVMEHFAEGTSLWKSGQNVVVEGPFTYNVKERYARVYDDANFGNTLFPIPLSSLRNVRGAPFDPPITTATIERMKQAYHEGSAHHDEL